MLEVVVVVSVVKTKPKCASTVYDYMFVHRYTNAAQLHPLSSYLSRTNEADNEGGKQRL